MWYEPVGGPYFQRGMSLKQINWGRMKKWVDHCQDDNQHERNSALHDRMSTISHPDGVYRFLVKLRDGVVSRHRQKFRHVSSSPARSDLNPYLTMLRC